MTGTAGTATAPRPSSPRERQLLSAAPGGDQRAFAELVDPHPSELLTHCYRMLGSYADAEDAVQGALLRAWRALPRFEGRSSLRSWLYPSSPTSSSGPSSRNSTAEA
jgi:RNA polymerase sigma-70 factor (ECF subfamily)